MEPTRFGRRASRASHHRQRARSIRQRLLLALALLALALIISPLGLGLANAEDDGDSNPGVTVGDCADGAMFFTVFTGGDDGGYTSPCNPDNFDRGSDGD
jgi:hypothetical protein